MYVMYMLTGNCLYAYTISTFNGELHIGTFKGVHPNIYTSYVLKFVNLNYFTSNIRSVSTVMLRYIAIHS